MSNKIQLMSISELLGRNFYVPAYQRGYRWTQQQVTDLLEDIYSFATKKGKKDNEFYCLQPIIVKPVVVKLNNEEREVYEVIDGQQRLTTIRILFSYLIEKYLYNRPFKERYGKDLYTINYETRPGLVDFLDSITNNSDNIEFHHVSKAYQFISTWFTNKVAEGKNNSEFLYESIIKPLAYNIEDKTEKGIVQVIWYELDNEEIKPIDIFIRINMGKIALTNAELIKALFLQERNFGSNDTARLRQLEIAQEWDLIENQLRDENFWWFLNKDKNSASSHIEFIFDLIQQEATSNNDAISVEIGTDKYRTFRYYNLLFGNSTNYETIKSNWDKVKNYFNTFKEWYLNPTWYHYIGFLIYCGKSVIDIKNTLNTPSIKTKDDATETLINEIKNQFVKKINWESTENGFKIDLTYNSDKELLRKFLLMYNLEYIVLKCSHVNLIYRFPFKTFKTTGNSEKGSRWDIEHIIPTTENLIDKREDREEWLNNIILDIVDLNEDLKKRIQEFITNKSSNNFEKLYDEILGLSSESEINDENKNTIGNLTLLDAGTNRGYGNGLFTTKRRKIIEKDREGIFIPICTKNVFLKYYSNSPKTTWTIDDINAYYLNMAEIMSKFLKPKPTSNEKI